MINLHFLKLVLAASWRLDYRELMGVGGKNRRWKRQLKQLWRYYRDLV